MIITRLAGGLGNQMYQYATGRRLAQICGVPLKLDVSGYGVEGDTQATGLEGFRRHVRLTEFNIKAEIATAEETAALHDPYQDRKTLSRVVRQVRRFNPKFFWPVSHFRERRYRFDPDVLTLLAPRYLSGFWQSEKYFSDVAETIHGEFAPRDSSVLEDAHRHVASLRTSAAPVVSVHVRRGDMAYAQEVLKNSRLVCSPPTSVEYIHRAMAQFEPGCRFLVFSDSAKDIAWCKANIQADQLSFSEGRTDVQDMMLMSACDHHIIASTFSWWAAWLDTKPGRRVIAPSQWGYPSEGMVTDDLIPSDWKTL